jgi:hypothetical protein
MMTQPDLTGSEPVQEPTFHPRDWVLLPAVSVLTLCLMAISVELLARWFYPVTQVGFQNCFATNDPTGDAAVKPNSVCWEQIPESTLTVEYRFNHRGHRAGAELTPKPPGTYRIVLIGSSFAQGLFVPREKTFAALFPEILSTETGRNVEVYNESTGGKFRGGPFPTQNSARHFDEVLAPQPDLILWVITPTDIVNAESRENADSSDRSTLQEDPQSATHLAEERSFWSGLATSIAMGTLRERLKSRWEEARTSVVLKHLLIASESQDEYINSYLKNGDDAEFLKVEPDAKWQMQLHYFDVELAEIVRLAKNAMVPLVAVFIPNRPQAAMISKGNWPSGYDPFKLEDELRDRVVNNGGRFIDILPDYRDVPSPERDYFPMDGHPDADGHAIISRFLAKELTSGAVPELKRLTQPEIAMQPGRP